MNSQLQESSSLIKCDYCHDINKYTYNFSCNHNICCICLYRRIFSYNLKEIQNENEIITINCKCEKGKLGKNFDEIVQIIHKKSLLDKEYQNFKKKNNNNIQYPKCDIHSLNFKSLYCVDCFENICSECLKNEIKNFHIDHRIIAGQKLENLIKKNIKDLSLTIPNKDSFVSKFDLIGKKLKETTEKEFNETIKLIDNFANSLFQFRKEYEEIYRNELTRCVKSLKLIKLFYLNYFYDKEVSLDSKNINLLRFVNNISFEFIDLNLIHNKIINSKISEMQTSIDSYFKENNKEKNVPNLRVELIFNEVPRNFKCENIISKAHNKQIRALLETQDQKLISSGYDFKMKFWEEKENGYELNSEIKNLCGAVTCVIQIKDGRILSSSASDNNIKVWKENSNGIYELSNSLSSHNKPISCIVELNDLRFASASIDTSVIIWFGQNNEFIVQQKISDEKRPILNIISLSDCRIAFTTDEGIIKIWGENNNNNNIVFNKFNPFTNELASNNLLKNDPFNIINSTGVDTTIGNNYSQPKGEKLKLDDLENEDNFKKGIRNKNSYKDMKKNKKKNQDSNNLNNNQKKVFDKIKTTKQKKIIKVKNLEELKKLLKEMNENQNSTNNSNSDDSSIYYIIEGNNNMEDIKEEDESFKESKSNPLRNSQILKVKGNVVSDDVNNNELINNLNTENINSENNNNEKNYIPHKKKLNRLKSQENPSKNLKNKEFPIKKISVQKMNNNSKTNEKFLEKV
jgi:hypothetical protein